MLKKQAPPASNNNSDERPFDKALLGQMLVYIRKYRLQVFFAVSMLMVTSTIFLSGPYLIKVAIDTYIMAGDFSGLLYLCALFLFLWLIHWGAHSVFEYYTNIIGEKVGFDIRMDLFEHLQKLSMSFFDTHKAGWIISRLTGDINAILEFFNYSIASFVNILITFVGTMSIMLFLDVHLSLVIIFSIIPPLALITFLFSRKARQAYRASRVTNTDITINLAENINGVRVTQSFVREERNLAHFQKVNRRNYHAQMHAAHIMSVFMPLVHALGSVGTLLVLWFGGRSVAAGTLTLGVLVAFFGYIEFFFQPIRMVTELYNHMLNAMASAERIFSLLGTSTHVLEIDSPHTFKGVKHDICFDNVHFAYHSATPILKGIHFRVTPGQTIALVGSTGAGKSSIMSLISRFYDYQKGCISIDGIALDQFSKDSLRQNMGIVLQDTFLFNGSIRENILYGRPNATPEEVEAVATVIGADIFINAFPEKYETQVQEQGGRLSSGQRQLISFSRALLRNPNILILDEATSSIDAAMELKIQHALEELLKDRICFVAAHRLSTIRRADHILVIHEGMIAEQGTHHALLAQHGMYRDFYETRQKYTQQQELER